jgi:hypothetical protein
MKSNHLNIVVLSAIVFLTWCFLPSCTKTPVRFENENAMTKAMAMVPLIMTDSANVYNCVWLIGNQVVSPVADSAQQVSITATFTDSITKKVVGIKGLSVNTRTLTQNPDSTFYFGYSDSSAYLTEGLNLYGTNVAIKITGSSLADTVTQSIYQPKKVYGTSFPTGQINTAKNLALNWTPDAGNAWGNVVIKLWYNSSASRFLNDSTLPAKDTALTYTVPDNGSYTIDSTDLKRLKPHSYVTLSLGRGSEVSAVLPVSRRRVFYFATASETSTPVTLIYAP